MQIGEFAKLCNTKISVLRHYDKIGLIEPAYTDLFTGYRYYSADQAQVFERITVLKNTGFSLPEIKMIFAADKDSERLLNLFEAKKAEIEKTLQRLYEAKTIMLGESNMSVQDELVTFNEDINFPFVNDSAVVGKWTVLGVYQSRDDFYLGKNADTGFDIKEIYFLPGGERYWCYSWTKGKLLIDEYESPHVENYTIEEIDGEKYMLVDHKSYQYIVSGKTELLVLKQADSREYTPSDIARKDSIDMPFVFDAAIVGQWTAWSFCRDKSDFSTEREPLDTLYWKSVEFFTNSSCTTVFEDDVTSGDDKQTWTKNYLLRKYNSCACEYEIKTVDGVDYMIIEWKSGDYRYGGFDTNYYIFTRA